MKIADGRLVFDTIPEEFDRWRARYSQELFDYIVKTCGLDETKRCLEIGPGTGQATDFALKTGCRYLAIELGENLAKVMEKKYSSYPNFSIKQGDFEQYPLEKDSFDLIYSAATIQWIREDIAYRKCFELLKDGGYLAMFLMSGNYKDVNPALYEDIQKVYDRFFVSEMSYRQKFNYLNGEAYGFRYLGRTDFKGQRAYTADEYIQFAATHSDHITLKEEYRESFFGGIHDAVLRHGDRIVFDDTYILYLYQKP